ncbi:MAG: helix-turn-helix domain-containing protein [Reichenbachiella sp.]|uniref:helix-turn-helix domain-containing protein n=1 Tax=Reichenbachiella sp. TaxID=2184521 RepID=UPI002966FCE8|nr:helix-turn-helix domain-containing protein [Reichenbachiella sp.]MDW3208647.1 helix-turn-helix domain-containing protein [Reichenbachiella sp.]MDW3210943.1 helix-turn-helix domain-containing protein [Reichenbachiella sp.]MDW3211172.1 helix-turn-helix domain-containing protein [Reichenbachiella sp.]
MNELTENKYVKRTQKDYSYAFKLSVVSEVESGELGIKAAARKYGIQSHSTVTNWLRKFGNFDWVNKSTLRMPKSKDQKLYELEQKVRLLEKQKKELEQQVENADKKAIFFDMMIDIAEEEFKLPIRKKSLPQQLIDSRLNKKKG